MAMNPMQRKVRNSFLFGFIVALLIGAVIIGLLIMKNKQAQEEIVEIQKKNEISVGDIYVTSKDVEKDEAVALELVTIPKQNIPPNAITDENIGEYMNDDGEYEMIAKIAMKKNTPVTTDFIDKKKDAATYRMVEYNMISLPSMLEEGEYIDIRLACLGLDSVVLSKIQVQSANSSTIWLKLSESQLLTLNYAIVESYILEGCKIYATQYTDDTQPPLTCTYIPADRVVKLVEANVADGDELKAFYERKNQTAWTFRDQIIASLKGSDDEITEETVEKITEGYQAEKSSIQAARDALLGDIGY